MTSANTAIGTQMNEFDRSAQPDDAPHHDDPDTPSADELFCDEAMGRLRCNEELQELVEGLRARERDIALVSKRVYKESYSFEKADRIILEGMGTQFDPRLEKYYEAARPKLEAYYAQSS